MTGITGDREEHETHKLLTDVGLARESEKLAGQLSGGMKRKLCVALALIADPLLLVLDEATSGKMNLSFSL